MYLSNVGMGNSVRGRLVELVAGVVRLHLVLGNYFNLLRYKICLTNIFSLWSQFSFISLHRQLQSVKNFYSYTI